MEDTTETFEKAEIELEVNRLTPGDYALLFDSLYKSGYLVKSESDRAKEVALGFRAKQNNGKYEFVWYYCGKAEHPEESYETIKDKKTAQTQKITFTFYARKKEDTVDGKTKRFYEHNGQYAFVDNVNRYQDKLYVCYDNTATKDNVGDTDPNYKALSFAFPTTSGWQLLEGFDPEHPLEMWCEKLGGSSVGKGNGAYLWSNNNAAWYVLSVFGGAGSGASAGLPFVSANDGSGLAIWRIGGVLLKKRQ